MSKKLTYEFVKSYIESFDGYKLVSEKYINNHTKLIIKHLKCCTEYEVRFRDFKVGNRCPKCAGVQKLTYEFVKNYIESFEGYKLISEEYVNNNTKLKIKHLKCGTEYEVTFGNFKSGYRCPECGGTQKLTYENVRDYINSVEGYKLISKEYINNKTKLIVKHLECGTKYEVIFNSFKAGYRCPYCSKYNTNKFLGVVNKPLYDTYSSQIEFCEEVRRDPDNFRVLQVKCKNSSCRKWFTPTRGQLHQRLGAIEGKLSGEFNFYCSDECKYSCVLYRQQMYPKGYKKHKDKLERDPYWRKLVFERDKYECQICGATEKLKAHHIDSIYTNIIMSADLENGITLCKKCHDKIHSEPGCRYIDLTKNQLCKEKDEKNYNTE